MKKLITWLGSTYSSKPGPWIMLMLLSGSMLPLLLKSLTMLLSQNPLPIWFILLFDLIGWIGMWFPLYAAIRKMNGYSGMSTWKGLGRAAMKGGLWLAAVFLLSDTISSMLLTYGGILALTSSTVPLLAGQILFILLSGFLFPTLFYWNICIINGTRQPPTFFQALLLLLKKPLLFLGSILLTLVFIYAVPFLYKILIVMLPGLSPSFLSISAESVLISLMQWFFLLPLLTLLSQNAPRDQEKDFNNTTGPATPENKGSTFISAKQLPALFAIIILLATQIYNYINTYPISPVETVRKDIQYLLTQSTLMRTSGDFGSSTQYLKLAEARILAWRGSVLDFPDAFNQAVTLSPEDEQVKLLIALKNDPGIGLLEQGLLNSNRSKAWYLALLDRYNKTPAPNDIQKNRKSELLKMCILQNYFSRSDLLPEDFPTNTKDKFSKMLDGFTDQLVKGKYATLVARLGEEGTLNGQLVLDTLDMSEKYPDQINIQYLAMTLGNSYKVDNATHYKRTADAALRYDKLYMLQNGQKASEDKIISEKLTVANILMACNELQACTDFISGVSYKSDELKMIRAGCLFSLKSYDECLKEVSGMLKGEEANPQKLYLAAMSALQLKDVKGSIQYAAALSKIVQKEKNPLQAEQLLYPFLLRFSTSDGNARYITETYNSLKEDEKALLQSEPFLYNYATALSLWSSGGTDNLNASLGYLDKVLSVRNDLSRAIYVKGAINFELQKDENAISNYKSSLALDDSQPTVWYALANVYDKTAKYDEAYAACLKVLENLPSTDHASDVYGISVHASGLLDKLKQYVKEGS